MNQPKPIDVPNPSQTTAPALRPAEPLSLAPPTPLDLIQRAVSSGAQVEVMEKLLGLQERWERNEARKAFDSAIAKAKAEIPIIRKGNVVDFTTARGRTNYAYEDLADISSVVDPILSKFGLSYRWRPTSDAKGVTVTCILSHSAGHFEENSLYGPHDLSGNKNAIQAVGSTVTYLQRYTLKAALGLAAAADDDARSAGTGTTEPASARQTPPQSRQDAPGTAQEPQITTYPVCTVKGVREVHSKAGSPKAWTAYFITFDDGFSQLDAATFSKSIADLATELSQTGEQAKLTTKPGRKPNSREIVSLERTDSPPTQAAAEDDVPMEFDDKGQPIKEVTP